MTSNLVNSDLKKLKKNLNDLLSIRLVQRLTDDQKQEIYREALARLFNKSNLDVLDDKLSNVDKLFHFDLMKSTLIKIGKLISDKFKLIDNLDNDKEEIRLIQVLSDTIDRPITLPYLIPNLCECALSSIELLFNHFNSQRTSIEVKIDEKFDKKLNDKINERLDEKLNPTIKNDTTKKVYKIYSNKTSKFYEEKKITKIDKTKEDGKLGNDKRLLEQKIDEIAMESNKLHQLNQQYRRNKEETQDELLNLKDKYYKLAHELEEKNLIIVDKQNEFEELDLELNTIKVQLESIYKQNQLLDSDKLNLSSSASSLQRQIQQLERQNNLNGEECDKLKRLLSKRDEHIQYLEKEFSEKKSNLDRQQIEIKKLVNEEQSHRRQFEQLDRQEKEIKLKYEKLIKELEAKQQSKVKESIYLKEELDNLKIRLDDKVEENFKLNLELKECNLKIENLKKDKEEDEDQLKKCRENKSLLLKKLDQNVQELNRFKKLNLESGKLIENKTNENVELQNDLKCVRNENIELNNKLSTFKNENSKQFEQTKKSYLNEIRQKNKIVDELNQSLNDLKVKMANLVEEKGLFLKLFDYIENISDLNQQLPFNLNFEFNNQADAIKRKQQISLQFEHYLDVIKELKNEFKSKQFELNRLNESNKLIGNEYDEQNNFLQTLQQKLNSSNSQIKIKDCELIHLRDELAEFKVKRNEDEIEKMNSMKENDNLKAEKSSLELLKLELKKQITNCQLRNVELEKQLQINLNKIIELDKFVNESNEKYQQLNAQFKVVNERLAESLHAKDQLDRELNAIRKKLNDKEQLCANEKELNLNLNKINQQLLNDKNRLESNLVHSKADNQQLENDLDKIEKEFKDYENRLKGLIDDRNFLIDLLNKYNIILKSHLDSSLQLDENCLRFVNNRTNLKLIKPECLIQSLLDVRNDQSKFRRQLESMKLRLNDEMGKLKETNDLNCEYKALIEFNETTLLTKKMNYERLYKEQKDFRIQLDQMMEENEKLKIEKNYLTEKVLNLDKILETTKEFMERKLEETSGDGKLKMINKRLREDFDLNNLARLELNVDQNLNLDEMEMRLIFMHDSLTEFINILMNNIDDYKEKINQLNEINQTLNSRLNEMNHLLDKNKGSENNLQFENERLKKELITSNLNSKEVNNRVKQLTNQLNDVQDECLTLQNSIESNR